MGTTAAKTNEEKNKANRNLHRLFLFHLRPLQLPQSTLRFSLTFGLGGCATLLFGLLVFTGMLLMLVYEASPEGAYASVSRLYTEYRFGGLIRNIHYWSANLLVAVAILHMLRVFFTGAFHGPRRINWIFGGLLLFFVLGASFTGYLLPWDQLAFWAVTISTGMLGYVPVIGQWLQEISRGGEEVGTATMVLFYGLHTSIFPVTILVLMGFHFWRVRKAKGVVLPPAFSKEKPSISPFEKGGRGDSESTFATPSIADGMPLTKETGHMVPTYPDLLIRELVTGIVLIGGVLMLSVFFDAPLGIPANEGMSPNPAKAPWYFMGFQELQLHFHPIVAVVLMPLTVSFCLLFIPYLQYDKPLFGTCFLTTFGLKSTLLVSGLSMLSVFGLVVADDLWIRPATGVPSIIGRGVAPLILVVAILYALRWILVKRFSASTSEVIQSLFALFFFALLALTITGVWFRGEGMVLSFPFLGVLP